jgi:hypothetical protein
VLIHCVTAMGVDATVLVLTIIALARKKLHSHLWRLLFQDGLIYFCITFMCNAVPAVSPPVASIEPVAAADIVGHRWRVQILNVLNLNSECKLAVIIDV